ncbi:MAG TPA: hypothetical protein VGI39_30985 [Polyangiaceae bacterium]
MKTPVPWRWFTFPFALAIALAACSDSRSESTKTISAREARLSPAQAAARAAWSQALSDTSPAPAAPPSADSSTKYPAFTPNAPRIDRHGGVSLVAPKIVTVTWGDDPNRDVFEAFDDQLGASSFWNVMSEWGTGPATPGGHVHVPGAFPSYTDTLLGDDSTFQQFIRQNALDPSSGWPQYSDQTIYVMWIPQGADFSVQGMVGCQDVLGYHSQTSPTPAGGGSAPTIVYASVFYCGGAPGDSTTYLASHEIAEAASDPYSIGPFQTGINTIDEAHGAYNVYFGPSVEIADACGWWIQEEPPPFAFNVQRLFSNAAFAAGHGPCVPALGPETYYNATTFPSQMDDVKLDLTVTGWGKASTAKGFKVPIGQSRTFDVGFYSDGPTGDWTLQAVVLPTLPILDADFNPIANGGLDVKIDKPKGSNGHVAHVTVTPTSAGSGIGASYFELRSGYVDFPVIRTLPILVGQE